jgi:hypothetical protein
MLININIDPPTCVNSLSFMSSATHTSRPNFQLFIDALASYADKTGIDLSTNPFAEKLQHLDSPDAILGLLHDREKAFKEYREGNRKIINWITPAVQVIHAFSGVLGESISLVSSATAVPLQHFHTTSPGPFPTSESRLCWYRCPAHSSSPLPASNRISLM